MERSLEMAQTKLAALLCAALMLSGCHMMSWRAVPIDASRTGVVPATASNVDEAMGTMQESTYTAPNGKVFDCGSVPAMARAMLDVQPEMADLKQFVCRTSRAMNKNFPESELSNFIVDRLMTTAEEATGRKVDIGITNFGGIRVDLPEGDIVMDDIVSMLPFKNYISYVTLSGEDVQYLFDSMAGRRMQVIGGARVVMSEGRIKSLEIGGEPLDPARTYGVATVDFLLDGGDSVFVARNAKELIITDVLARDAVLPYAIELGRKGEPLEYHTDGRVVVEGDPFVK